MSERGEQGEPYSPKYTYSLHARPTRRIWSEMGTGGSISFLFGSEPHWERNRIKFKLEPEYVENLWAAITRFPDQERIKFCESKSSHSWMIGQKLLFRVRSSNNKSLVSQLKKAEAALPPTHYSSVSSCTNLPLLIIHSFLFPLKGVTKVQGCLRRGPTPCTERSPHFAQKLHHL